MVTSLLSFTMNFRTPPSLNWLIKKYSRKQYELNVTNQDLLLLTIKRNKLIQELEALKAVLAMHEIPIKPEWIPPKRQNQKFHNLKRGDITRSIFECLKNNTDNKPLSITAIFLFSVIHLKVEFNNEVDAYKFRLSVRKRLKGLVRENRIKRVFTGNKNQESTFTLI